MTRLPTTTAATAATAAADTCCEESSPCDCASAPARRGVGRLIFALPVKAWLYLLLLVALYVSVTAYAWGRGDALGGILIGGGFEYEALGTGVIAALTGVWLAAGEMLTELMPYWLIGMLLAGALMGLATWQRLAGWLRSGGLGASAMAAGTGSAIPICSCGMAPLLGGMTRAGVPLGPAMAFVIAAPMINVPAVLITGGALGAELAAARVIGTLVIAMSAAMVFGWWAARNGGAASLLRLDTTAPGTDCSAAAGALDGSIVPTSDSRTVRVLGSAGRLFLQMNGYLLLAVLLGGAIRAWVPAEWIAAWVGGDGVLSVIVASGAASVLYFCTYTEVPTAAALVELGMGPGATLAYLLVGPGISLPSLALLSAIFRPKLLIAYASFAFACAVVAGVLFNGLSG